MNFAWNEHASPVGMSIDQMLYRIRKDDGSDGLIFDSLTLNDVLADDGVEQFVFDAMVTPFSRLRRKMDQMLRVMNRAIDGLEVTALQVSEPFRRNGVAQVAAVFELSDGQTVTVYFHNPDSTPAKLTPTDEMVSWKWLLNKKDITIVVAPEKGQDLAVREVSRRIMRLADRNGPAFARQNAQRAERLQRITGLKEEVSELEQTLEQRIKALELAQVEAESRALSQKQASAAEGLAALNSIKHFINRNQYRSIADAMRGEEKVFFIDKARLLADIINGMAESYEQDGKGMDATAYLHYFSGSHDWYITEKDSQSGTRQAFGWADLGQGGELGYISIDELTRNNIELNLHFDPTPLSAAVKAATPEQASNIIEPGSDMDVRGDNWNDKIDSMSAEQLAALHKAAGLKSRPNQSFADALKQLHPDDLDIAEAAAVQDLMPGDAEPPVIEIRGDELGVFADTKEGMKEMRAAAFKLLMNRRQEMVVWCPPLGANVGIQREGASKISTAGSDKRKLALVVAIDRIVAGASKVIASEAPYVKEESKKGVVAYHKLRSEVMLDGEALAVRFIVKEKNDGSFSYDYTVHGIDAALDPVKQSGPEGPSAITNYKPAAPADAELVASDQPYVPPQDPKTALDSSSSVKVWQAIPDTKPGDCLEENINQLNDGLNTILDSTSGKMVLNLFIEGEEPEIIEGEGDPEEIAHQEVLAQQEALDLAREQTDTDPSEAQKVLGDYQQGELSAFGLTLAIENPNGHVRSGESKEGNKWQIIMAHDYGYIKGTKGLDGDEVDAFIGPNLQSEKAFVIEQVNREGGIDEHKVMLGFDDEESAKQGYLSCYAPGWDGLGAIREMSLAELKAWLPSASQSAESGATTAADEYRKAFLAERAAFEAEQAEKARQEAEREAIAQQLIAAHKEQEAARRNAERQQRIDAAGTPHPELNEVITFFSDEAPPSVSESRRTMAAIAKVAEVIKEVRGQAPSYQFSTLIDSHWQPERLRAIALAREAYAARTAADNTADRDRAFLQSVIDGTAPDMLASELGDEIAAVLDRHADTPYMMGLLEQAVMAYQAAMLAATANIE